MIYHARISHNIEHIVAVKKAKICADYAFTKRTPYLIFTGELWGIFCELFGEKILKDIKSVLYYP